jgi:hypothetical protein
MEKNAKILRKILFLHISYQIHKTVLHIMYLLLIVKKNLNMKKILMQVLLHLTLD